MAPGLQLCSFEQQIATTEYRYRDLAAHLNDRTADLKACRIWFVDELESD
jgi:hypothetical protein